jgi:hypothetical protein
MVEKEHGKPGEEGEVRHGGKRAWQARGVGAHREGSWRQRFA